jgi:two-component system NtrC family sensor kinase
MMQKARFYKALPFKMMVGVVSTLAFTISFFLLIQFLFHKKHLIEYMENLSNHLSYVIQQNLEPAMLRKNSQEIQAILRNLSSTPIVSKIMIVDKSGEVKFATNNELLGEQLLGKDPSCQLCHQHQVKDRSNTAVLPDIGGKRVFRSVSPIRNRKQCHSCHEPQKKLLGVLISDFSMAEVNKLISQDLKGMMISFGVMFLALIVIVRLLMGRMVLAPLRKLVRATKRLSSGDFSYRVVPKSQDEIGHLADSFNEMARQIDQAIKEKTKIADELDTLNKTLEERVEEATSQLRELNQRLIRTETLSAVGNLASAVSHEISTPLGIVLGYVQVLLSELEKDDPRQEDLRIIEKEAIRCKSIIEALLNFARPPSSEKIAVNINDLLEEILDFIDFQPSLKKKITINKRLDPNLIWTIADPGQLKQVFLNLIMNALQAMPRGGELTVSTQNVAGSYKEQGNGSVRIDISDTGCGIPPHLLNKIFEPFFTTKEENGTGLGLAISYRIIEDHLGNITVTSQEDKGTTLIITLPIKDHADE